MLLTGMSGTGKSSLLHELAERGHDVVDTDLDGWCVLSPSRSELLWDEPRMGELLARPRERPLVMSGCVANQGVFRDRIDLAVLLSAPEAVILRRVRERTTNPYGSTEIDRSEIVANTRRFEPLLRAWCDLELDATRPLAELADVIEARIREP